MRSWFVGVVLVIAGLSVFPGPSTLSFAQAPSGTIHGQVSDPSKAGVGDATVSAVSTTGQTKAGVVNKDGTYEIRGLAPGKFTVKAQAKGFTPFEQPNVQVAAGQNQKLDISLAIEEEKEQVTVSDTTTKVGISPDENASAMVIKGDDLQALSDDPDELQSELEALAGPSAGPNGGQIYIDGFTGGQLPPKADILEIRVNQNPFSAEYDKLGYGRIEITTRPGASQFHGQVAGDISDSLFNSRNPFVTQEPSYHTDFFNGSVGGPLGKKASFFFSFFRRNIEDDSIVSAEVLSPDFTQQIPFSQAVSSPRTLTNLSPRFDLQLSNNNVLTTRYQFFDSHATNSGIGLLNLPSLGYNTGSLEDTLQVSDTQVFSARTLNRLRFQFLHDTVTQTPQVTQPTISVLGNFTGGGSSSGTSVDTQDHYELQNLTSFFIGKNTLVVGGRLRDDQESNSSTANFNGTFSFPNLKAYQTAEQALQACNNTCGVSGPNLFSITAGQPFLRVNLFDVGLFAQDDWQVHKNMTLSLGLRWESQTDIHDHSDFAPRLGYAWGLHHGAKGPATTVLRAGAGIFYDRFPQSLVLQSERLNGINQQQFLVPSPNFFPNIPSPSTLAGLSTSLPSVYQIAPNLRAPYILQTALSLEQQVSKSATISITYLHSHGLHQLLTDDINAPLPGTFALGDPSAGIRPFGNSAGNLYQYQSNGIFTQNQIITNFNLRLTTKLSLFGYYSLGYVDSDTTGNSAGIIMNPYDFLQSYGRASFDVRNRFFISGNWNLPHRIALSPFLSAASGAPFNVTGGQDLFGTGMFNARPALVSTAATPPYSAPGCTICVTPLGTFNTLPAAGQALIPSNDYPGPGQFTLNLRLSKTFNFGKEKGAVASQGPGGGYGGGGQRGGGGGGGGGPRGGGGFGGRGMAGGGGGGGRGGGGVNGTKRYNLTFSVYARNLLNNVNYGQPIGVVGSRLFDTSDSLGGLFGGGGGGGQSQAANRRLDFQITFSF